MSVDQDLKQHGKKLNHQILWNFKRNQHRAIRLQCNFIHVLLKRLQQMQTHSSTDDISMRWCNDKTWLEAGIDGGHQFELFCYISFSCVIAPACRPSIVPYTNTIYLRRRYWVRFILFCDIYIYQFCLKNVEQNKETPHRSHIIPSGMFQWKFSENSQGKGNQWISLSSFFVGACCC